MKKKTPFRLRASVAATEDRGRNADLGLVKVRRPMGRRVVAAGVLGPEWARVPTALALEMALVLAVRDLVEVPDLIKVPLLTGRRLEEVVEVQRLMDRRVQGAGAQRLMGRKLAVAGALVVLALKVLDLDEALERVRAPRMMVRRPGVVEWVRVLAARVLAVRDLAARDSVVRDSVVRDSVVRDSVDSRVAVLVPVAPDRAWGLDVARGR
jgi:hypothetical protein